MKTEIISYPRLAISILFVSLAVDFLLQHVMKLKNVGLLRILLLLGGIYNMSFFWQSSVEQEAAPIVCDQVVTSAYNSETIFAYLSAQKSQLSRESSDDLMVLTKWGQLKFSQAEAALIELKFSHIGLRVLNKPIATIGATQVSNQIPCFLSVIDQRVVNSFYLLSQQEEGDTITLVYEANLDTHDIVRKQFVINKQLGKIDVRIDFMTSSSLGARTIDLFYPGPADVINENVEESASAIFIASEDKFERVARADIRESRLWKDPMLFGIDNRYFVHALIGSANCVNQDASYILNGTHNITAVLHSVLKVEPCLEWSFYFGPKESSIFQQVDKRLEGTLSHRWQIPGLPKFFLDILNWLYSYLHNYGLAIIVLTLLIKVCLFPFAINSTEDPKKKDDRQKKLAYIKQRFKNDPEGFSREQMEFFRKEGLGLNLKWTNVVGFLLQLPIFITLNRVIAGAVEIYGAPMLWISDLSARDPYFILPFFVGVAIIAQAFLIRDKSQGAGGIIAALVSGLVFGALMSSAAAGLVLYVLTNTVLGIMQTNFLQNIKKS